MRRRTVVVGALVGVVGLGIGLRPSGTAATASCPAVVWQGSGNTADNTKSCPTASGGYQNAASNNYATVGGGYRNTASGVVATIGGGEHNTASGSIATPKAWAITWADRKRNSLR